MSMRYAKTSTTEDTAYTRTTVGTYTYPKTRRQMNIAGSKTTVEREVDVNIYTNKMTTENQLFASLIEKEGAIREKSVDTNTVEETQTLQTRIHKD